MILVGCSNLSQNNQSYPKPEVKTVYVYKEVDSFYTVRCQWPQVETPSTPQETLYQLSIIMDDYRDCYVRHNSWVEEYQNGH